jgi:hypothetical protein
MTEKKTNNYIDNKKMLEAFIQHKKTVDAAKAKGEKVPDLPNYIGECFSLIAEKTGSRGNFSSYTFLDEMKEDGIESCIIGANNFDPERSNNPFGYFTQAVWFAFLRRIEKEAKQNYIKFKLKQNLMISTDENINVNGGPDDLKIMDGIIKNFEDKKKKKKEAAVVEIKKNKTRFVRKKKQAPLTTVDADGKIIKSDTSNDLIAAFLSKGGKITYVATGVKSSTLPDTEEEIEPASIEEVNVEIPVDEFDGEFGSETDDDDF